MRRLYTFLLALALVALAGSAWASAGSSTQGYDLSWWTVDAGGGTSGAGVYALSGTAGQPDAGPALSSGAYTLTGGFWYGAAALYDVYLPLVLK